MPDISPRTRLLAVLGYPVEHSLSPRMQNAALRAAGIDAVYLAFSVAPAQFETAVRGLAAAGAWGLNLTVPHKRAGFEICDEPDPIARLLGVVNTIRFDSGRIIGTNTDVEGYVETVKTEGLFDFAGRKVVQFGAGGAGRSMGVGAVKEGAAELVLVNRTIGKARELAALLGEISPDTRVAVLSPIDDTREIRAALESADLVANATSLGLHGDDPMPCPAEAVAPGAIAFDAAYTSDGDTAWLRSLAARGNPTINGLGMLVRQGAAALRFWTGAEPDLRAMFDALP